MIQNLKLFRLPSNFRGRNPVYVQLWWFVQAIFIHLSPQIFYGWRRFVLRRFGAKIGKGVIIRPSVRILYPWKLTIGDWSWIGDDVNLYSMAEIKIGNNTVVSQNSYLCTGSHNHTKPTFDIFAKKIVIEDEAWIATDVFVAPGVTIAHAAVIAARSTVLQDMPAEMICAGNPAKPIKQRISKKLKHSI